MEPNFCKDFRKKHHKYKQKMSWGIHGHPFTEYRSARVETGTLFQLTDTDIGNERILDLGFAR
jgi:hypothetical protein